MGIERFFFGGKSEARTSAKDEDLDTLDTKGKSRRMFILGSGALVSASVLHIHEAKADSEVSPHEQILTGEDRERNAKKILELEAKFQSREEKVFGANEVTGQSILNFIYNLPPTDTSVLEGTALDHEAFFRSIGWPAKQIRIEEGEEYLVVRSATDENIETEDGLYGYGNGFVIKTDQKQLLVSNGHMLQNRAQCEVLNDTSDIAGCSLTAVASSDTESITEGDVDLVWKEENESLSLDGTFVHIPSIHELRGQSPDNTDITSGFSFKVTQRFLDSIYFPKAWTDAIPNFQEKMLNSYIVIIPPRDVNSDGIKNSKDVVGISGSPVFTNTGCSQKSASPVGVVWAAGLLPSNVKNVSHTFALIHGPDVLGAFIHKMSPDDPEVEKQENTELIAVTTKIQEALNTWRKRRGLEALTVDGDYGKKTKDAVYTFQFRHFGKHTESSTYTPGIVDAQTWEALFGDESFVDILELAK